uniref:p0035H10.4 protein n=1 Tax=Oryza sativa subsp. japonica TaxID=39947 RepID=Q9FP36_ORYSJ|nr:P0035H10.4 [Oryza sativa Japonica Group]
MAFILFIYRARSDPAERVVKAAWYKGAVVTHRPKPVSPIVNQSKNKNKQAKKPKPAAPSKK